MQDKAPHKTVPAVENAVLILRLIASSGQAMGVTIIARKTGLSVSSAFNILRTLTRERLISFDSATKTYALGMGVLELVIPLIGANPASLIRPVLHDIAQQHQVMVALWQITQDERIVLVDRFSPERVVQAVIADNSRLPVFSGAVGRCYVAMTGLDKVQARKGYDSVRWQSEPGFESYWRDVVAARDTRHAFDQGNLFCGLEIAAAVARDADGVPRFGISSISITGQISPTNHAAVAASLVAAADRIEHGVFGRQHGT